MDKKQIQHEIDCKTAAHISLLSFAGNIAGEIKELESELAEAEKHKLRDFDIGVDGFQKWIKFNGHVYWIHDRDSIDLQEPSKCEDSEFLHSSHTNIIDVLDDLKAMADMPNSCSVNINMLSYGIKAEVSTFGGTGKTCIRLGEDPSMKPCNIEDVVKFHRELGGVIANAKKKKLDNAE